AVVGTEPAFRIGYIADRFPCASQDFVLQEILELEALGFEVHVLSLGPPEGRLDYTAIALGRLARPVCYFRDSSRADADRTTVELRVRQARWAAAEVTA